MSIKDDFVKYAERKGGVMKKVAATFDKFVKSRQQAYQDKMEGQIDTDEVISFNETAEAVETEEDIEDFELEQE